MRDALSIHNNDNMSEAATQGYASSPNNNNHTPVISNQYSSIFTSNNNEALSHYDDVDVIVDNNHYLPFNQSSTRATPADYVDVTVPAGGVTPSFI